VQSFPEGIQSPIPPLTPQQEDEDVEDDENMLALFGLVPPEWMDGFSTRALVVSPGDTQLGISALTPRLFNMKEKEGKVATCHLISFQNSPRKKGSSWGHYFLLSAYGTMLPGELEHSGSHSI